MNCRLWQTCRQCSFQRRGSTRCPKHSSRFRRESRGRWRCRPGKAERRVYTVHCWHNIRSCKPHTSQRQSHHRMPGSRPHCAGIRHTTHCWHNIATRTPSREWRKCRLCKGARISGRGACPSRTRQCSRSSSRWNCRASTPQDTKHKSWRRCWPSGRIRVRI